MRLYRGKVWCLWCVYFCALFHGSISAPVTGKANPEATKEGDKLASKEDESKGTQTIIRPTNVFRSDDLKLAAKGLPNGKEFKRDLRPFEWLYNTLDNYLRCAYSNGADCEGRLVSSIKLGENKDHPETVTNLDIAQIPLKEFIPYGNNGNPYNAYSPSLLVAPLQSSATLGWFDRPFSGLWKPAFPMHQNGPSPLGSGYVDTSFDPFVPMIPSYYGPTRESSELGEANGPALWGKHRDLERPLRNPLVAFPYNRGPDAGFTPFYFNARSVGGEEDDGGKHGFANGPWGGRIVHPPPFYGNPMPLPMMKMHTFW
ncbi:unnamed protein product [Dicrocoelium dendriticum]|nr:unnamed protein product [Dicrocoelium dendriticum]